MTTLIDSLVVALNLDSSGFKKGEKEAVNSLRNLEGQSQKTSTEIEAHGKRAAEAFGRIRNQVLALTAAVLGAKGIVDFTEKLTATDAATGRLAKNLNMSTQDLAAWEGAVKRTGGTADGMAGSLQSLTSQFEELHTTGNAPFLVPLARAGVDMAKFLNDATPMTEKMALLHQAFIKLNDPAKAQYLGAAAGIDQGTINLLLLADDAFQKLLKTQRELTPVSKVDTDAAIARQNAWADLQDSATGLGRTMLTDVTPEILAAEKGMKDWVQDNKDWVATDIGKSMKQFGDYLKTIDWKAIRADVDGITQGFEHWGTAIANILNDAAHLPHVADTAPGGDVTTPADKLPWWVRLGNAVGNVVGMPGGSSASTNLPSVDKATEAGYLQSFMQMGYTKAQASGLVANIMAESGGNANAVGDNGAAYGLGQWHADRQKLFAQQFGHDIQHSTADEQLKFYNWELHNTERRAGSALAATNDPGKAGSIVSSMDERPHDALGESYRRAALARGIAADPSLVTGAGAAAASTIPSVKGGPTSKTNVSIGTLNVNAPKATDAKGIAANMGAAIRSNMAVQPNVGQQ